MSTMKFGKQETNNRRKESLILFNKHNINEKLREKLAEVMK